MNQLTTIKGSRAVGSGRSAVLMPAIVADAGEHASRRFLEFFAATIRNNNTRMAYYRAVTRFFDWCDHHKLGQLVDIEPLHVAAYIEGLGKELLRRRNPAVCDGGFWPRQKMSGSTACLSP